jgi:hypothetical protein
MADKRISLTINEVCRKLGIDYQSINPNYVQLLNDAKRLGEIFRELKIIAGDLEAIADRNQVEDLKKFLHRDALKIEKIDHDLISLAKRMQDGNIN